MYSLLVDETRKITGFGVYTPNVWLDSSKVSLPIRSARVVCRNDRSDHLLVSSSTRLLLSAPLVDKAFSSGFQFLTSNVEVRLATALEMRKIREGEADYPDRHGRYRRCEKIWDGLPPSEKDYLECHTPSLQNLIKDNATERVQQLTSEFDSCEQAGKIGERIRLSKEVFNHARHDLLDRHGIAVIAYDVFAITNRFRDAVSEAGESFDSYEIVGL